MGLKYNKYNAKRKAIDYSSYSQSDLRQNIQTGETILPTLTELPKELISAQDYISLSDSDSGTGDVGCRSILTMTSRFKILTCSATADNSGAGLLTAHFLINGVEKAVSTSAAIINFNFDTQLKDTILEMGDTIECVADGGLAFATTTTTAISLTGYMNQ